MKRPVTWDGIGTRYDQIDAKMEQGKNASGLFMPYICDICGKQKGKNFNHEKCSKIRQRMLKK